MQGQSSVNFFDIYNKKRNQGATGTPSGSSAVSGITNNTPSYTSKYTKQMEDLDKDLMAEGLKIEKLSNDKKRDYVNSLSESEYQRLNQYRDAGYSFGASKALLDLERQRTSGVGGARSQAYQMFEPIGGQESKLNKANFLGYLTEKLDNRVQEEVVPRITVSEREKRTSKLRDKYKNMTDADWDKLYEEFVKDPKAKTYDDDSKDYTLKKYWIEKNTDRLDDLFSVGDQLKVTENADGTAEVTPDLTPGGFEILANVPASTLATSSAVIRGVTNPVDNLWMITQLLATKEGRGLLADRYLSREGAAEAFEKDPIGRATDLFDLSSLLTKGASSTLRGAATAQRLAGYKDAAGKTQNAANRLGQLSQDANTVADLGISDAYDRILNKALARLSQGGRVSNAIGDYVSLTQQPLRTIWKGAGGINPKTGQPYNQTTGKWTFDGLQPALNKVWDSAKEKIQNQATGLTPEVRERIRQNPFIKEYRDRIEAMLNEQGAPLDNQRILEMPIEEVGQELLRRLEEYEAALEENGSEYQALRQTTRPYDFSDFMAGVYEVFAKNGITVTPDGELTFATTANPADMNPVNIAWNVIKSMEPNLGNMTIAQLLDFRKQLRSLINYESDSRATRFSKGVIRQIVDGKLNKIAHKEIPSLAKVDEIYNKQINELKEFKDGLVYQQGEKRGQIKDNFYSIISTINTQNRQKMKARLEKIFPDLGARVEAIRMLPILAKTYQNSPKLVNNMLKTLSALTGMRYSKGPVELALDRILGIIADELISKPLGEKWRKVEIRELLNEMSPEAQQKLAEIKSKIDAGVALSEQEKQDLATAMQEIAQKEYEYLDEKHQKEFDKIMESANNQQPKLPQPGMDTIGPDGTIKLGMGNQINSPEEIKPKTREERIQEIQAEGDVTPEEAEEITNGIEDFLDEIGADIEGNITPGEVNYDRFSTRVLEELMEDKTIPRVEKDKIGNILARRSVQPDSWEELDQKYAYKINKLMEEEQRIGKVGKNKVKDKEYAAKQMREWEKKKERLIEQMSEDYGIDQFQAADKYVELEQKGPDYIKQYKKSKRYAQDQAELEAVDQLRQRWSKQPEFTLKLDQNTLNKRKEIISNELKNGYEWEETGVGDRFTNGKDKGVIKYNEDGTIDVVFTENGYRDSGVMDILPDEAWIRFEGEPDRIQVKDLRGESEYQTVGRANPDERDVSAEEGMETENYKGNKTVRELADDYGLEVAIVDKIFTEAGEEALGRAKGNLIELVKEIKEGTAPHEVFHPIFNMVNGKRRAEIIDLVRKNKGMTEKEAKEWLADNFSEYFRTGKFDTKPIPKGFVNKVKWFFNKVKEFLNGTRKNRKKIQKLFDDIMDGKISVQKPEGGTWEYQIQQKSLFDQEPEISEEDAKKSFTTDYDKLYNVLDRATKRTGISPQRLPLSLNDTYTPDLKEWLRRMDEEDLNDRKGKFNEEKLIDLYHAYEKLANNPATMQYIKQHGEEFHMKPYYELLTKMKEQPLQIPEDFKNEKWLGPLRNALYELKGVELGELERYYDPDVLERENNLRKNTVHSVPIKELYVINNLLDEYVKNADPKRKVKGTFADKPIQNLIDAARNRTRLRVGSYDKKQIEKVGSELEEILNRRTADLALIYDRAFGSNDRDLKDRRADERGDFVEEFIWEMGNTYDPDVEKWHKNLTKRIKEATMRYEGFKPVKNYKDIIKEHQLNSLKAKIEEFDKYSYDDITSVIDGSYADVFMQAVKPKIDETKVKGTKKAVRDLIALHDLELENFEKQMKGFKGKSPMPSIAIQDPNVPSGAFGDITLLFGRDTVDPKVDERNVIYGSDARTPVFPGLKDAPGVGDNVTFKQSEVQPIIDNIISRGADLTRSQGEQLADAIRWQLNEYNTMKQIDKWKSEGQINEIYELAERMVEDAVEDRHLDRDENEGAYIDLSQQLGDMIVNRNLLGDKFPQRKEMAEVKEIEELLSDLPEGDREKWMKGLEREISRKFLTENMDPYSYAMDIEHKIRKNTGIEIGGEEKYFDRYWNVIYKIEDIIRGAKQATKVVPASYFIKQSRWSDMDEVADKFTEYGSKKNLKGAERDKLNGLIKDILFEYMGDELVDRNVDNALEEFRGLKDFNADDPRIRTLLTEVFTGQPTDRPLTPENVLEAMKRQRTHRETHPGSYRDMIEIEGTELNDIEDVRRQNFAKVYQGDRTGSLGDLEGRYNRLMDILSEYIYFQDDVKHYELMEMVKDAYDPDVKKFKDNFPDVITEDGEIEKPNIPEDILQRIIDVVEQGKKIPIRFSEGKPRRIVDLTKEVKYILVPETQKARAEKIVRGTPLEGKVVSYKQDNNSAPRVKKIKELQKKYGDVFFSMGGVVMPIAMLMLMMQQEDEGQA